MRCRVEFGVLVLLAAATPAGLHAQTALPVVVVGAAADGFKLTRSASDFRHEFRITSTSDKPIDVTVSVPSFLAPDTTQVAAAVIMNNQPARTVTIQPADAAVLVITATLPRTGAYATAMTLTSDGKTPMVVPIQVTRSWAVTPVQFKDVDAVRAETRVGVTGRFALYETSGQDISIYTPELSGVARIVNTKREQVTFEGVPEMSRWESGKATPLTLQKTLKIPAGSLQTFEVRVSGLSGPGEYAGTLRVTSADSSMVEQTIAFFVRRPAWRAGIAIGVGLLLSVLLRWYLSSQRPTLVRRRTIARLREKVDTAQSQPDLHGDEKDVLGLIRSSLGALDERLDVAAGVATETADIDAALALVGPKLDLFAKWVTARRHVDAITPPELAAGFRETLDKARDALRQDRATKETIDAAAKGLAELPSKITAAVRTNLTTTATKLGEEIEARLKVAGSPDVTAALVALRAKVKNATGAIHQDKLDTARVF